MIIKENKMIIKDLSGVPTDMTPSPNATFRSLKSLYKPVYPISLSPKEARP